MRAVITSLVVLLVLCIAAPDVSAKTVGWIEIDGGSPAAGAAITAAGHTPVALTDLTAGDLAGIDLLWILNGSNGAYAPVLTGNLAAISAFITGGGGLLFHDRFVTDAATVIPGAGGVAFFRDFTEDSDIDILPGGAGVATGPGGVLDNTSLDGGTSSSHGFANGPFPAGTTTVFSQTTPGSIVDFFFPFGAGQVYYSTIPLDHYLSGNTPAEFNDIYAPNVVDFAAGAAGGPPPTPIPEPGTFALFGLGALGIALHGRRRRKLRIKK